MTRQGQVLAAAFATVLTATGPALAQEGSMATAPPESSAAPLAQAQHTARPVDALATTTLTPTPPPVVEQSEQDPGNPFGLGFQASWPAWGISGIYDVSDKITTQAVLGAFGTVSSFSGRGLYHFQREPAYSVFGFGSIGLWRYSYRALGVEDSESTIGVGGGAGVELSWQEILSREDGGSNFPSLFSSIDLGLTMASFDHYDWSVFTLGVGVHYRL